MLQVTFMYFFTGLAKVNPFWLSGDATEYALYLEMSVRPLGSWLSQFSTVLWCVTLIVLIAELLTLFLLFIPRFHSFSRGMFMGFFWMMHLGIWLTMSIGLFSLTAMVAWVVFVPGNVWNTFFGKPVVFSSKNYQQKQDGFTRVSQVVCGVFLAYIVLQNIVSCFGPGVANRLRPLQRFGETTMTIQQFHMFAKPPLFSPWFEYPAELRSGARVDLFNDRHKRIGKKPESVFRYMKNQTWRRLHWNLITHPLYPPENESVYLEIRYRLLHAIIDDWNAEHFEDPVIKAELKCHLEPINLPRINPGDRASFANHENYDLVWASFEGAGSLRR